MGGNADPTVVDHVERLCVFVRFDRFLRQQLKALGFL